MFTEWLPINDGGIFTQLNNNKGIHIYIYTQTDGIYEVHHLGGLRCRDIHAKFHKDWFSHSEVDKGGIHIQTAWSSMETA